MNDSENNLPVYTSSDMPEDLTTNATNSTEYEPPRTSDSHLERCPDLHERHWCFNEGRCHWVLGINRPSCECINDFEGDRCQIKSLSATEGRLFGDYWEVFVIGTIFGIVILVTLIVAIVYVFRKRKQTQATRRQSNFTVNVPVNGQQEYSPDANQNTSSDKYAPLATSEPDALFGTVVTNEDETLEVAFADSRTSSTNSFKLQDPPSGRKSSSHSTAQSTSPQKESTV